jgi:hypothetical protein
MMTTQPQRCFRHSLRDLCVHPCSTIGYNNNNNNNNNYYYYYYYGSTALCWALATFQFLDTIHSRYDSLDGDQPVARPLTYTQSNTNRINEHTRHICLEWDSNPRSQCSSERRQFMFRPHGHCDRLHNRLHNFYFFLNLEW